MAQSTTQACTNCKTPVPAHVSFCPNCGTPVSADNGNPASYAPTQIAPPLWALSALCRWVLEPAKDQQLEEAGPGKDALTLDHAWLMSQAVGFFAKEVPEDPAQAW